MFACFNNRDKEEGRIHTTLGSDKRLLTVVLSFENVVDGFDVRIKSMFLQRFLSECINAYKSNDSRNTHVYGSIMEMYFVL